MLENLQITQAKIKDSERIAILCEQLGYSATKEQIEERLSKIQNNNSHIIYVATVENDYVIGWAHAHISDLIIIPNQALLFGLVVDENYRNNGIGRLLMEHIEKWATLFSDIWSHCSLHTSYFVLILNVKRLTCFMKKLATRISNNR